MTRQSTNPDDEENDDDESLELTDQTDLGRTVQHLNNEPAETSTLIGQESIEPSGSAAAAREDSLVAVSTIYLDAILIGKWPGGLHFLVMGY